MIVSHASPIVKSRRSSASEWMLCFAVMMAMAVVLIEPALAQKKLSTSAAKEHFGETAAVCGEVVSTRYASSTKGQPTFLNLDRPYPNQIFTVVIWGDHRAKFGKPEDEYRGKRICVTGKITAYAGLPEIVADDPKQIKVEKFSSQPNSHSLTLISLDNSWLGSL